MWTKIENGRKNKFGRAPRTSPAVMRARTGKKSAAIIFPGAMIEGSRVDIYSDGNGKVAFDVNECGQFSLILAGKYAKAKRARIPKEFESKIPFGTTDVQLSRDGDMFVLDLSKIEGFGGGDTA